jgi:hypothetical protein
LLFCAVVVVVVVVVLFELNFFFLINLFN